MSGHTPDLPHAEGFSWPETRDRLRHLWTQGDVTVGGGGRWYEAHDDSGSLVGALRPPLLLTQSETLPDPAAFVLSTHTPGTYGMLLLQAGAAALGLFHDDDVLDHKALKKYVVRGKGRAQPTHLKTRGKSRYGSRLRLQNAALLLEEVSARLHTWWERETPPERLYVACPTRLLADLGRTEPPPPAMLQDEALRLRIPLDVHVPTHAELMRVQRSLSRGRAWSRTPFA